MESLVYPMKITTQMGWADLPEDILNRIMKHCFASERVMMSSVCKNWLNGYRKINSTREFLPWVMSYHCAKSIIKLFDPATKTTYTINPIGNGNPTYFDRNTLFCDSKNGWVLFSNKSSDGIYFFFYSPFTNESIILPKVPGSEAHLKSDTKATFSSVPSSPDCMVIFMTTIPCSSIKFKFQTYRFMDEDWKTLKSESFRSGEMGKIVYSENFLYCVTLYGDIHSFDMNKQEWGLLPKQLGESTMVPFNGGISLDIIVPFNGGILLDTGHRSYRFFRLDVSKTEWIAVSQKRIKNYHAIFSDKRKNSYTFSVPLRGNAKRLRGNAKRLRGNAKRFGGKNEIENVWRSANGILGVRKSRNGGLKYITGWRIPRTVADKVYTSCFRGSFSIFGFRLLSK